MHKTGVPKGYLHIIDLGLSILYKCIGLWKPAMKITIEITTPFIVLKQEKF